VVTELAVLDITPEGFLLIETAPGVSADDVKSRTLGRMQVSENVKEMQL
jgi:3-oxoacid CoA-transferase subunit B